MTNPSHTSLDFIHALYKSASTYKFTYVYNGGFSQELTDKILSFAEANMEHGQESSKTKKKVYFIMVESLQNITRHQDAPNATATAGSQTPGFFLIHRISNNYHIISGNVIENDKVNSLKEILDKVNSLDQESLKALQKEVLSQGSFSEKGGAGLGLIEMARKSGNKLVYDFKKINDELSFFYFQTNVTGEGSEAPPENAGNLLPSAIDFHKSIGENSINLLYEGEFSQDNLLNLLTMTEGNIGNGISGNTLVKRKIFNIIVELLQNIYKHGDCMAEGAEKTGIFLIGKRNGKYFVSTGNPILKEKAEILKSRLEKINSLSTDQLNDWYGQLIKDEEQNSNRSNGLGLIDTKLKSHNNISYEFIPLNDKFVLYTIQVNINEEK